VDNIVLCGYETPTPIQAYTIPAVLEGHDMIGVAQTGSSEMKNSGESSSQYHRLWQNRGFLDPMHLKAHG
jgi:hypothetical protein